MGTFNDRSGWKRPAATARSASPAAPGRPGVLKITPETNEFGEVPVGATADEVVHGHQHRRHERHDHQVQAADRRRVRGRPPRCRRARRSQPGEDRHRDRHLHAHRAGRRERRLADQRRRHDRPARSAVQRRRRHRRRPSAVADRGQPRCPADGFRRTRKRRASRPAGDPRTQDARGVAARHRRRKGQLSGLGAALPGYGRAEGDDACGWSAAVICSPTRRADARRGFVCTQRRPDTHRHAASVGEGAGAAGQRPRAQRLLRRSLCAIRRASRTSSARPSRSARPQPSAAGE